MGLLAVSNGELLDFPDNHNVLQNRIYDQISLTDTNRYNGGYYTNLFEFKNRRLNYLALYINGISLPGMSLALNTNLV